MKSIIHRITMPKKLSAWMANLAAKLRLYIFSLIFPGQLIFALCGSTIIWYDLPRKLCKQAFGEERQLNHHHSNSLIFSSIDSNFNPKVMISNLTFV
jgi:hypothetical protein